MWENPGGCSETPVYLEFFYSIQFSPLKSNDINNINNNKYFFIKMSIIGLVAGWD
jgi:hypothetical protein